MATSFKKKSGRGRAVYPPGTRPSLHNNQLLVSSGVPSMDNVIGGGIAVGTVFMVEDTYGSYARQLSKYFLAEGVISGHSIFLASAEPEPNNILMDLPQQVDNKESKSSAHSAHEPGEGSSPNQSMKIAWRYQNQPKFESSPSSGTFGHYYDLTRVMDKTKLSSVPIQTFIVTSEIAKCLNCTEERKTGESNVYRTLIARINSAIKEGGFTTADKGLENRTILRIVLHGLGSPLWGEEEHTGNEINPTLTRFLFQLRATLRSSFAVCFVTVPTHLFQQDPALTRRVERFCDTVVKLESFTGSENETNPVYKDYHGLFHIVRLPRLNSLVCHMPDSFDLAFKLRRKKMTIEKLHLPPELSETANRTQEDSVRGKPGSLSCQSMVTKNRLDF
ncbi:elongator complex protein 4-like isoform X3 [Stylophora pistillata]|uniref:elongator complex protein 4-like isoform X3 n=1 Tax=Stylophora pistillata TaxID=50429 RepID=UPI000C03E273|nr:elongator complex protein 4-like isoform X3 [Stylophora pistillata]